MKQRLYALRGAGEHPNEEGDDADAGFTLIELMVVLLIMAILLAIAIPTFLGVRSSAQDRAAQTSLSNALTEAKTYYANNQDFTGMTATTLGQSEPSLTWTTTGSTGPNDISVGGTSGTSTTALATTPADQAVVMTDLAADGTCWVMFDLETTQTASVLNETNAGVYYTYFTGATSTDCNASTIAGLTITAEPSGGGAAGGVAWGKTATWGNSF
ncbi:MAG: type II secretion system protein [Actinobacteria bacterium]|nr:type II secretion system protein [Actinomycetota bacterium]